MSREEQIRRFNLTVVTTAHVVAYVLSKHPEKATEVLAADDAPRIASALGLNPFGLLSEALDEAKELYP